MRELLTELRYRRKVDGKSGYSSHLFVPQLWHLSVCLILLLLVRVSVSSTSFLVTGERRPWLSHDLGNYFKFILK